MGVAAGRTRASVYGAPALPSELQDAQLGLCFDANGFQNTKTHLFISLMVIVISSSGCTSLRASA